MPMPMPR